MISNRDETGDSGASYEEGLDPERLQQIDGTLREHIPKDARLESGVPPEHRSNELDFIQMTGIARRHSVSMAGELSAPLPPRADDLDPSRPISFYEKGVMDVDSSSGPRALESPGEDLSRAAYPQASSSRPIDDLKSLVDDLARETGVHPNPPGRSLSGETGAFAKDAEAAVLELDWGAAPAATPASAPDISGRTPPGTEAISGPLESIALDREVPLVPSSTEELAWAIPEAIGPSRPAAPQEKIPEAATAVIPATPLVPGPMRPAERLVEAEQLMQALEQQPRDLPPMASPAMALAGQADEDEGDDGDEAGVSGKRRRSEARMGYEYSAAPTRRRRSRRHSHSARRMVRYGLLLAAAACITVAGAHIYQRYVSDRIVSAEELWRKAEAMTKDRQYATASRLHREFAYRFPDDPKASEAQFDAGYLLQLERSGSKEAHQQRLTEAAELLNEFVAKNAGDRNRARAVCLLGAIYCGLGRYAEAADLLRDPKRQLDDPDAALPILRTLAVANLGIGNYDGAESAYLQAVVLPKNYSCDQDYRALGDLFRQRADGTPTESEKKKYLEMALKYWKMAVEVSAMDPADRKQIQQQIDRMETETGAVPALPGAEPAQEAVPNAEAAAAPKTGAVDIEPAPGDERRQLSEEGKKTDEDPTP